jgi:hypothetical protein
MSDLAQNAVQRYSALETERNPFETRARDASELTIPTILTRNMNIGGTGSDEFGTPFQSVGARGVNNLAAKLTLTLFPPGSPFFRLIVDRFLLDELQQVAGENTDVLSEFENALVVMEKETMNRFELNGSRQILNEVLLHLIVTGNGLLQIQKDGKLKFHRLDHFVVRRDVKGDPMEIIFREGVEAATLPPEIRELVEEQIQKNAEDHQPQKPLWLYTVAKLEGASWQVHQEIQEIRVPDSEWSYPAAKPAFIPLRWRAQVGEDYGRGFVEQYMGDLMSLESLSQSIIEFAAVASKVVHFVDESGLTDKEEIQNAPNGAILDGNAKDITTLQLEKMQDFQVAASVVERIERRLEQAFLLNSSVQRDAERVTAEEIRYMANELETALGGVYSTLAGELQLPLVTRLLSTLARENKLPRLPEGKVDPQIITGIDGLGRTAELQRLDILLDGVGQMFGPEAVAEYIRAGSYIQRRAAALGVDVEGLIRSEEEVAQQRQAQQQAAMQQAAAPQAIQQTGQIVQKGMDEGAGSTQE